MLIPPKRLFHIPSMSTVMYVDVADDVKKKGYVAVSHVWGNQQLYSADKLGINSGVDWMIPLSNTNKISRLVKVMNHFKMEYCWFDVLCMPQDKQDEINLEIPFMGDYYNGADMTLVLSTTNWNLSADFRKWFDMVLDAMDLDRDFTDDEEKWMESYNGPKLLDVSKEEWFTRVWTFQEAILSNWLVVADDETCINLSGLVERIEYMNSKNPFLFPILFDDSNFLERLGDPSIYKTGTIEIAYVLNGMCERNCYKIQDKFYGALGILGYKDFVVDYNTSISDLNKMIAKYAYSRGDISWMSVYSGVATNFIQPMYDTFVNIGTYWKEDGLNMIFGENSLRMNASPFATIVCSKKLGSDLGSRKFMGEMVHVFRAWKFNNTDIIHAIGCFHTLPKIFTEIADVILDDFIADTVGTNATMLCKKKENITREQIFKVESELLLSNITRDTCVVKAVLKSGKFVPIIIFGDANVGDFVVIPRMKDSEGRSLGIVYNSNNRKGICICLCEEVEECTQHKFLL